MVIESSDYSHWLIDYGIVEAIPIARNFESPARHAINASSNVSVKIDHPIGEIDSPKAVVSRRKLKSEPCSISGSKACREKLRRDQLNERFLELGSILEPGRPPKADKAAILSDAVRLVMQLRSEAEKLRELTEDLQEKIKELKGEYVQGSYSLYMQAEKNELRDEKQKLEADKQKLPQQVKTMSSPSGLLPHLSSVSAAAQSQAAGNKLVPFIGYPSVAMWQFMPPAAVDTSQDLRPPIA